eukprot:TRINITY_DN22305_c0_g1_i1.p1 TRINITY_DN22305_c0_g1~~TRINITY_DN22305_c0_g1_i1.p1  ORF type:complete len:479 (+),score=58.17 TRINITY_DN22305_c0_g1_i1:65-1501(+)
MVLNSSGSARLVLPASAVLEFITDVEGNWDYFCSLVDASKVLRWDPSENVGSLSLVDDGYLVFGGDAPDKGPGDIRITRALVLLQRAYPQRVYLIAGNRDVNKLRFVAELAEGEMPDRDPVPYLDAHGWEGAKQQFADFLVERGLERTRISALQWILEKTMGGGTLMKTRRAELDLLGRPCSDQDVLESFVSLVDPEAAEPWGLEYLRVANVMLVIGDCVFVHGAILRRGLLLLPAEDCRDGRSEEQPPPLQLPESTSLDAWAAELNSWKARQLRMFEAFPRFRYTPGGERWRGGQPLMFPSLAGCHVMTDVSLVKGNQVDLDNDVADYLRRNNVRRVFYGHVPHGQSPGVVRHQASGVAVVFADTSYSDMSADKSSNPANCRGRAVSTVTVTRDSTAIQGVLSDGTKHGFTLHSDWDLDDEGARLVGCQLRDTSWGRTVVDGKLQTFRGEGFVVHHELLELQEARARLIAHEPNCDL